MIGSPSRDSKTRNLIISDWFPGLASSKSDHGVSYHFPLLDMWTGGENEARGREREEGHRLNLTHYSRRRVRYFSTSPVARQSRRDGRTKYGSLVGLAWVAYVAQVPFLSEDVPRQ